MAAVKRPAEEAIGSEPLKAANGTNGADASQNADERPEPLAAQTPETVSEAPAKRQKVNSGDNRGGGNGDRGGKPGKQRNTRRGTWQSREKPESDEDADDKDPRAPKKKVALLMSFCGTGYQGMQINPNARSIEGDLWKALVEASAVSKDNAEDMKKVSFVRAARTDKGVHALGQVCSLKMINVDDADLIPRINSCLPDQIRVWGTVRVNKSFNAKNGCDSRIYEYLLPTYVFIPPHPAYYPASKLATNPNPQGLRAFPAPDTLPGGEPAEGRSYQIQPSNPEEIAQKREFRMAPDQLTHLRAILNGYLGTKNFHNFTVGKKPEDVSAKRYIMSFVCSDPFVKDGMEWVSLKIKGQSFMLHQIRKMIGLAIVIVRTQTPVSFMQNTFTSTKFNVPKAPALGLLLREVVYDTHNSRQKQNNLNYNSDITFSPYEKEIEEFKDRFITSAMVREETENLVFDQWVRIIDCHAAEIRWYLKEDGTFNETERPKQSFGRDLDADVDAIAGGEANEAAEDE